MRTAAALALCLAAAGAGWAQAPPGPPPEPAPAEAAPPPPPAAALDTGRVEPRLAPNSLLRALAADPAFQYDRALADRPSLWERFQRWFVETFLSPALEGAVSRPVQVLLMALAMGAAVWVVLRLVRGEGARVFGRRDLAGSATDPLLDVDDIGAVDLAGRLGAALARADHREAVRLRYLLALQRLDEDGLVAWSREKTNRAYVAEVRRADAGAGRAFAEATRVFDWVWYGGLAVDAARYARFEAPFAALDAALGRGGARPTPDLAAPPRAAAP